MKNPTHCPHKWITVLKIFKVNNLCTNMFLIAIFYVLERISQEKNDCTLYVS